TNTVTKRAMALNIGRSLARMLILDSKEEYGRDVASLAGIDTVLEQFALRFAAAAGMPVSLLFGQAPAGLNATGAADVSFFERRIGSKQTRRLKSQLKRLTKLIFLTEDGPTNGEEPERWTLRFRPLSQPTELE